MKKPISYLLGWTLLLSACGTELVATSTDQDLDLSSVPEIKQLQAQPDELPDDLALDSFSKEDVVDPDTVVSGSSSKVRNRFENQDIPANWRFTQYIYKFTKPNQKYYIKYETTSGGPIYGVLFTRDRKSGWNKHKFVFNPYNLKRFYKQLEADNSIDVILLGFISKDGGRVDATVDEDNTIARQIPSPTPTPNPQQRIVDDIKYAAKSDYFKLLKLADPEGKWDVLNDGVLKEVAKGTTKAIKIGSKIIDYVDLYTDITSGLDEIESQSRYYNQDDLNNMKLLLGLEMYVKHFGDGVFGGSVLDVGAFRRFYGWFTQAVHQSYNGYLGVEPKSFQISVKQKGWFFGYPVDVPNAKVKMIPLSLAEPNGVGAPWIQINLRDYDDRLERSLEGKTDSKGQVTFNDERQTKAGMWLVEVKSGSKTFKKYVSLDPRNQTIGFNQKMSATVYLD